MKLVKHLNGDKSVILWSELEDLALKDKENAAVMYEHVIKQKGLTEVNDRKRFLELD